MAIWDKLKFPTQDAKAVGSWAFSMLKPPTEDIATIGRALPKATPFQAAKKISYEVPKRTGSFFLDKLKVPVKAVTEPVKKYFEPTEDVRIRDVARQLPETGLKVAGIGTGIIRGMTRSGGSLGLTLQNIFADIKDPSGKSRITEYIPSRDASKLEKGIHQFIFGKESVKSLEKQMIEGEKTARELGFGKASLPVSVLGVGAIVALDFTGFGSAGKKVVTQMIAKADDVADIAKVLRQVGVAEDLILPTAKKMKTITKAVDIEKAFDKIELLQKSTKISPTKPSAKALETMRRPIEPTLPKATKAVKEVKPVAKGIPKKKVVEAPALPKVEKAVKKIPEAEPTKNVPAVIQGETFTLGPSELIQPTKKEARKALRFEIKATKKEIKNAEIATEKAEKLVAKEQKIRKDAIENIDRRHGNTDIIIKGLKKKNLSQEDIDNIVLENGVKLVDTIKVKRNADKSLATVITKQDINAIQDSYTATIPSKKWTKIGKIEGAIDKGVDVSRLYELPYVYFERKGLNKLYEPIIEAERGAEVLKTSFIKRFEDAGLWKKQGWFTADRFNLSSKENANIGKYYLSRQGKGYNVPLFDLSSKEKKFVEVFDGIIKDTEQRFFEIAKKSGKAPGKVENYAPIMTRSDIELIDRAGAMDFIVRKHPSFFSLKERAKKVPVELYETDYSKVAARWIDGITGFLNLGDATQDIKYLIDSEQFKNVVTNKDYAMIHKWLKDITVPQIPQTAGGQAVDFTARLLKKGAAVSSLGLNYATVVKQALTQIPISIIGKAPPKLKSSYAKAFKVNVKELPSLTKRKGDIAISDLQGKTGRIFTGAITEFDRKNAQLSLNALLDKEYRKFLKEGAEITPETQKYIEKVAQDKLDMWYGGFFKGQRPEAFRSSVGQFLNMFIYPLTSQLNGFYRHILTAKGAGETAKATAEVMAAATAIAYMEVAITRLSPEWSDEQAMTKDVLQSLMGNIPIISQISYALIEDQQLQVSAGISGITNLLKKITAYNKGDKEMIDVLFAGAEVVGLPKQIRRVKEGMEIVEKGGITDKSGKMLAPVKEADEIVRSFLRGKYGSLASQDWIRNIGEKTENRRWFVPQVEFLQNGDYERKVELYDQFTSEEQEELKGFLSEGQLKKLDDTIEKGKVKPTYDKIQKLVKEGRTNEAKKILNELSDDDYKTYKKLKSSEKRMETIKKEEEFAPTFKRIQELKNDGKTEEAKKILNDLSDEEYEIYKKMKEKSTK